ncbi:MAG: UDP-N-acetylmuramoyl-tripeptide--D-alanyl-D-alanine ligase [Treponema sp.]|nr:UDP-N-acetylmuramoyl-tripeptide--D-alanyl-D-alanine ligase [Treponema sp.]
MADSLLTCTELLDAVHGSIAGGKGACAEQFAFTSVATDSRHVAPQSLFVPLIGEKQNGHAYIRQAIENGASVILLNRDEYKMRHDDYDALAKNNPAVTFIIVEHTLHALQHAASAYVRNFPQLKKIGITGSSGKTTTKELCVAVLKQRYRVVCNEGNFNSETGLPLSVFNIRGDDEIGVFEMGMNRKDEIAEIADVLQPQYALVTNIGTAHVGMLGSRENIAREKRRIFDHVPADGAAFIPQSDDFAPFLAESVKGKIIYFGSGSTDGARSVSKAQSGVEFVSDNGVRGTTFKVGNEIVNFALPGMYNYENALAAVALGNYFGISDNAIKNALESFVALAGRSQTEQLVLKNGCSVTLVKDCYNANPESTADVLAFCASVRDCGNRIYVLGDMLELGEAAQAAHEAIGRKAVRAHPYKIIFIGSSMKYAFDAARKAGFADSLYVAQSSDEAMQQAADYIVANSSNDDLLLLKASRSLSFERLIPLIAQEARHG